MTIVVIVEATGDVLDTLSGLVSIKAYSLVDSIGTTVVWYLNDQNACSEIAYSGAGHTPVVLPKRTAPKAEGITDDRAFSFFVPLIVRQPFRSAPFITGDSVIFREDPRIVFMYPLSDGQSWTSFTSPWLQTRHVVGTEVIQTIVGSRPCAKIMTEAPSIEKDLEWYDYVSPEGLLRRTVKRTFPLILEYGPIPIGTFTGEERLEVLSITTGL